MNLNPSQGLSKHPTPNVSFVSPLKPIQLIWNLFKNWTDTFFLMISCPSQPTPKKLPLSPCLPCVPQSRWMLRTALILDLSSFPGKPTEFATDLGGDQVDKSPIYFMIFYKMFFLLTWESSWPSLPPKVEFSRIPQYPDPAPGYQCHRAKVQPPAAPGVMSWLQNCEGSGGNTSTTFQYDYCG